MFKYTLSTPSGIFVINPINNERTKRISVDSNGYDKTELNGSIVLHGSEFDIIRSFEISNPELYVTIEHKLNGVWYNYFNGYFYPRDCSYNLDECTVEIKLQSTNTASKIVKDFDRKFNIINLLRQNITMNISYEDGVYEIETETINNVTFQPNKFFAFIAGGYMDSISIPQLSIPSLIDDLENPNNNTFAGKYRLFQYSIKWVTPPVYAAYNGTYNSNTNYPVGNITINKVRKVRYVVANEDGTHDSPGAAWELVASEVLEGATIYKYSTFAYTGVLQTNYMTYRKPNTAQFSSQGRILPTDTVYDLQVNNSLLNLNLNNQTILNRFGGFYNIINYIYKQISGNTAALSVVSKLLFPLGQNQLNPLSNEANEYGRLVVNSPNAGDYTARTIFICQKSDFITPTATEPATVAELSMRDCLNFLKTAFNAGYYIDNNNILNIEHVSYFDNGLTYNIAPTTGQAIDIRQETEVKTGNSYEYETDKLVSAIRMRYADTDSIEFQGLDVRMVVTNNQELTVNESVITQFAADITYIKTNANAVSKDGFVIVVAEKALDMPINTYKVVNYQDPLTNRLITNGLLSVSSLYSKFYVDGLPFAQAYVNGSLITCNRVLKQKKQKTLKISQCSGNVQPYSIYRTGLGYGRIKEAEHLQDENALRLTLLLL
jgi:hypothetical protein